MLLAIAYAHEHINDTHTGFSHIARYLIREVSVQQEALLPEHIHMYRLLLAPPLLRKPRARYG